MEFADLISKPKLDGIVLQAPFVNQLDVSVCITGHHIIFSTRKEGAEEIWLMHDNIDTIERKCISGFAGGTVIIRCKDFRTIRLTIKLSSDFLNLISSLERLTSLDDMRLKYAFFYRPMYQVLEDGWTAFTVDSEFSKLMKSDEWRICYINSDFSICPSYPKAVVVPKAMDDETIVVASRFREGGRFPVLSYRHECGAALLRSSQPLPGPNNKRCKEDERLINCVLGGGKKGFIVDTRTQTLAQTAKSRGGGYEIEIYYPQWKRINHPIEKVSALLDSLSKLVDACNDPTLSSDKWLSKLDGSNWMTYLKDSLNCACLVAQFLDQEGASVLVHGAEGTDATLLVTSLTQIILNPDCRTVRGFEAVIEREWIQAGYPFMKRHAHSAFCSQHLRLSKSVAPTFLLFLDCVYQIHYQFPSSFEFLPPFLITLFENSYYSQFGTFLGNNEKEREQFGVKTETASLWSYINRPDVLQTILNPLYEPNNSVIWPSVAPVSLNLWSGMYLRWIIDQKPDHEMWNAITKLKEREKELRGEAGRLRRQMEESKHAHHSAELQLSSLSLDPGPS